jgi:hypothetical protein
LRLFGKVLVFGIFAQSHMFPRKVLDLSATADTEIRTFPDARCAYDARR